jgi:hypothetical protein
VNIAFSVLEEYDSIESLDAVLMDNTPVNTGVSGGLCACLEHKLGRKLHLIGCFLHINELPLCHLIQKLDGKTISGNKFSGDIGKLLDGEDFYRRDPVGFEAIPTGNRLVSLQYVFQIGRSFSRSIQYISAFFSLEYITLFTSTSYFEK